MALSLRVRIALLAGAAIVLAVLGLSIAVLTGLDRRLDAALDRSLRARAVEVARLAATTPQLLTAPGALEGRLGGGTLWVQVVDRRGRIVARSAGLGARVLPLRGPAATALRERQVARGDARVGSEPVRVYAAPLGELGEGAAAGGAVIVAGTTAELDATLSDTQTLVLAAGGVAAVLAALLALVLTARALRPLRRLSAAAREIETTGDASRRLPAPPAHDEVGQLTTTLNAMLAALEQAREAERRFVGDASHELRTPLTALRGNAAHAVRHGADPALLADIESDATRLSVLLDDLLALAREDAAGALRAEPVDLVALAAGVAGDRAELDVPEAPVVVAGEPPTLARAVENLVGNAVKHGPPGGRVVVTVRSRAGRALLTVEDDGPGVDPADAAKAFERFWRGDGARGEGSGLGLAIVEAIAERHGGAVRVVGSRFTLELPLAEEAR